MTHTRKVTRSCYRSCRGSSSDSKESYSTVTDSREYQGNEPTRVQILSTPFLLLNTIIESWKHLPFVAGKLWFSNQPADGLKPIDN